jgi:hypothetical protein
MNVLPLLSICLLLGGLFATFVFFILKQGFYASISTVIWGCGFLGSSTIHLMRRDYLYGLGYSFVGLIFVISGTIRIRRYLMEREHRDIVPSELQKS